MEIKVKPGYAGHCVISSTSSPPATCPVSLLHTRGGREKPELTWEFSKGSHFKYKKKTNKQTLIGNLQIASTYTQPLLLLQCLLPGDSVSGKRALAVPSCYLVMCKVEKLPFLIQPFWTSLIFRSATSSLCFVRGEEGGIIWPRRLHEMNLFLHSSS